MMKNNIVTIDWDDEILAKTVLTHAGERRNDTARPADLPTPKSADKAA
jgi:NAD(P) transhydrogenase subunit alpha